jgi:hypothetical protein
MLQPIVRFNVAFRDAMTPAIIRAAESIRAMSDALKGSADA